jgi:Nucleotidyltransferase domain
MVGSWARGAAHMASDVDFVVLTENPGDLIAERWRFLGPAETIRTAEWGAVTEQRLRLPSGLEIDLGIADPSWADTGPIDPGTAKVIRDGVSIVFDPHHRLQELIAAAGA